MRAAGIRPTRPGRRACARRGRSIDLRAGRTYGGPIRRVRRCAWRVAVGAMLPSGLAHAGPVVRVGAGANPAAIQPAIDQFRADLAGSNNGAGGAFLSGRREIDWDGVPDAVAEPNAFPFNFFNTTSPRGVVFESLANIGGQHQFRVSASAASGTAVRFGNIDASYGSIFQTFISERLFAPRFANSVDILFFVPGTSIPPASGRSCTAASLLRRYRPRPSRSAPRRAVWRAAASSEG